MNLRIVFLMLFISFHVGACSDSQSTAVAIVTKIPPAVPSSTAIVTAVPATAFPTSTNAPTATITVTPTKIPASTITPTKTPNPDFLLYDATPESLEFENVSVDLFPNDQYDDLLLEITRNGELQTQFSIASLIFEDTNNHGAIAYGSIMTLADLDLEGEIEIVLDIGTYYSTQIMVIFFDEENEWYQSTNFISRSWNIPLKLVDIDGGGRPEFITKNTILDEVLGGDGGAEEISPIQIFRYEEQAIVDVTYQYPRLLADDARYWLGSLKGEVSGLSQQYIALSGNNPEWHKQQGFIGVEKNILDTYMADMILLGQANAGCTEIVDFYQSGKYDFSFNLLTFYENDFCENFVRDVTDALNKSRNVP